MGFNEVCAYLHSDVAIDTSGGLSILFNYDSSYCQYFSGHSSSWTLELSERVLEKLGEDEIPAGVEFHKVEMSEK